MRAHIFLGALKHGKSVVEANGYASADMSNLPPEFAHNATLRANHDFGGVKLAMVSEAYRLGMHSKLPPWDKASAHAAFEEVAARRKSGGAQHFKAATVQHSAQFPATYDDYYLAFIAELKSLSGPRPDQVRQIELMEEIGEATGDNFTRQNFAHGVDPKEYAAAVYTVMQRNQATTDLPDFDSYFAAYIAELRLLAGTKPDRLHPAEMMDRDGAKLAYADGLPPQALAALIHEADMEVRQTGQV